MAKPGEDYVTFIGSDFVEEVHCVAEWLSKTSASDLRRSEPRAPSTTVRDR
jgi:hypothetical protein